VSIANNYTAVWAVGADGTRAGAGDADRAAAAGYDVLHNRLFTDPLLLGSYPPGYETLAGDDVDRIVLDGDLEVISTPLDWLGVNYYNPSGIGAPPPGEPMPFTSLPLAGFPTTGFDWPIAPDGLREVLVGLHERYPGKLPPIWIAENGCAFPDSDGPDSDRIAYLDSHLRAVHAAMTAGVDVRGYCVWSLLDNFEWAEGYSQRFGLVRVDFDTQQRTPRASFHWYRDVIRSGS
jgi:beta-glucosidase